jgi:excisionase family DNA binding protein
MGKKTHVLVSGERVDLGDLDREEIEFLRSLGAMARRGVSYFEIARVAVGPGSPALQGLSRVTRRIVDSTLYRVARDIATRAGMSQGLILEPGYEDLRRRIPDDGSLMSVVQAAELIGISRAAVYKAIRAGRIASRRYGNVTLVERSSAAAYRDARASPRAVGSDPTN